MQPNRSMQRPTPTGPRPAFAASRQLLPTTVREGDRLLRLLAGLRSVLVVHLARAAAALEAHEAWHLYCYKTRADFARERLHRDGRWLRDLIRLHHALVKLPKLSLALCGEDGARPLGQVATLLVARVATEKTVEDWIARARSLTVDELRNEVRAHLAGTAATAVAAIRANPAAEPLDGSLHATADSARSLGSVQGVSPDDNEPDVTVCEIVPPDVKWAFDAALDLHRSLEGGEVSVNGFVQALVAEAASSGCLTPDDFTPRFPLGVRRLPSRADHEPDGSARDAGTHVGGSRDASQPQGASIHSSASAAAGFLSLHTPAMRRALARLATFERLRRTLPRLDRRLPSQPGTAPAVPIASPGTNRPHPARGPIRKGRARQADVRRIARILEHLLRLEDALEIDLGDLLLEMHEHRAWRPLGFSGLEEYSETRLGIAGSTTRRRVALARELRKLPSVRQAYEQGVIGFMAAQWVSRGLRGTRADSQTQKTWIEHARTVTIRRLRHEERQRESERLLAQITIARSMTPRGAVAFNPSASPAQQMDPAISTGMLTAQRSPTPPLAMEDADPRPMDDVTWRLSLRRVPGATRSRIIDLGYELLERLVRGGPTTHTRLSLRIAASTAADFLGCIEAARRGLGARAAARTAPADDSQLAPSARMANDFVARGLRVPDWVGLLAVMEEWVWVHDDPRSMPRHPERRVLERDGYLCMAPGCTSRANLHVHHLRYRAQQGGDEDWNLLTLCAYHHLQGEHGGLARARGRAPLDVEWRLGCETLALHYRNERRAEA